MRGLVQLNLTGIDPLADAKSFVGVRERPLAADRAGKLELPLIDGLLRESSRVDGLGGAINPLALLLVQRRPEPGADGLDRKSVV